MALFQRPHRCACRTHVDVGVNFEALKSLETYEVFTEQLSAELLDVYGKAVPFDSLLYSTKDSPDVFASEMNKKSFDLLHQYYEKTSNQAELSLAYSAAEKEMAEREAAINPEVKLPLAERKQMAKDKEKLKTMKAQLVDIEYDIDCLQKKLANVFNLVVIRVLLQAS